MDQKEIAKKIERYFALCAESAATAKSRKSSTEEGEKYPPTMAGLAAALGMTREELLSVRAENEVGRLIASARVRVEAFAEEKLFDKNACSGAKYALARNASRPEGNRSVDPALLTDEELEERIRKLCGA